jgi:hypothetical protein
MIEEYQGGLSGITFLKQDVQIRMMPLEIFYVYILRWSNAVEFPKPLCFSIAGFLFWGLSHCSLPE